MDITIEPTADVGLSPTITTIMTYEQCLDETVAELGKIVDFVYRAASLVYERVNYMAETFGKTKKEVMKDICEHPHFRWKVQSAKMAYITMSAFPDLNEVSQLTSKDNLLPFWHYNEIACAKLPKSEKEEIRAWAEETKPTQAELRQHIAEKVSTNRDIHYDELTELFGVADINAWLQWHTDWHFPTCDKRFGLEGYPGRIPGQTTLNLLHFYTEPGDTMLSVFGGSGTDIDAAKYLNRNCIAYDIKPIRDDIIQCDVTQGFPLDDESIDFVCIDPPYFDAKSDEYSDDENNLAQMTLDQFYDAIEIILDECHRVLRNGKYTAFIIGNQCGYSNEDKFIDLGFSCYQLLTKRFNPVQRIVLSYCGNESNHTAPNIARAKSGKYILAGFRDLLVFKKC